MEAEVVFNPTTHLYELTIEIDGTRTVVSASKSWGHWEYHFKRGTLSKSVKKFGVDSFKYVDLPSPTAVPVSPVALEETIISSWLPPLVSFTPMEKKRGRPRKYLPETQGKFVHKISDEEPPFRMLSIKDKTELSKSFKILLESGRTAKESLDYVCKQFYLPYKQAHDLVQEHI